MTISVRLFAGIRRAAGVGELALELPAGATVADALAALAARGFHGSDGVGPRAATRPTPPAGQ